MQLYSGEYIQAIRLIIIIAGMRRFLHETVRTCREEGCIRMISGRVRYLPAIKDTNIHTRAHVSAFLFV